MGFDQHTKDVYKYAKERLIEEYFYGDPSMWKSRAEPFINFKHIFRRLVHKNLVSNASEHARWEGTHPTTLRNSFDTTINLHPKLEQSVTEFILEHLKEDKAIHIKLRLNQHRKKGYTHDDIARNYQVHENVIRKILNGEYVTEHTLNYIYSQL